MTMMGNAPFIDEPSEFPKFHAEIGSTFGFEDLVAGYGGHGYTSNTAVDGKTVFQIEENLVRDFKQMLDTDGKAQSVENLLIFPIISTPKDIIASKGDKGEADKVREILFSASYEGGMKTPIEVVILQMAKAMTYKKAFFERVMKLRDSDGLFGYEDIAWRPQETCELALDAETARYKGFRQQKMDYSWPKKKVNPQGYVNFNLDTAFVYIYGSWGDPIQGMSAMQVPYWAFQTKRRLMWLWYSYLDTTSLPKMVVKGDDVAEATKEARRLATLKARAVIGWDKRFEIDTLESSGKGAEQFIEATRFLDSEMSQSVLGGFMDLTASAAAGKGSFALSEDQSKLFLRSRRVVAWDMARQFNEQVIAPLVRWNFGREASFPKLTFGPLSEANEQVVIDTFSNILGQAPAGAAVPDEFYDQIIERVAQILELDTDKVHKAIQSDGGQLAKLKKATDVALGAVQTQQANQNGQTNVTPEEFLKEAGSKNGN